MYKRQAFQELFFQVNSEKSGGFDLVFSGIPAGSRLYRLDTTVKTETASVGTGRFTEVVETDALGNPVYATTEYDLSLIHIYKPGIVWRDRRRQRGKSGNPCRPGQWRGPVRTSGPVSYTHLDVYKRQTIPTSPFS